MLSGAKVLDFSRILAGPMCTMILGDLGANVIKVERAGGDETRGWGPPFDPRGESAYFLSVNRNKLSLAADIDSAADRELLRRLIEEADVVVENFRPGSLERRGLDPERFLAGQPSLIWCTIEGFGAGDPRPAYDVLVQAERGWMAITGDPDGPPTKVGVALADITAGKDAAIAVLAALVARGRDGRGRHVHVSLSQSAAGALVNVAQNVLLTGRDASRWGNAHPNLVPYQLFDTADRPIIVAVGSDVQWRACALALELTELAEDSRLATNAGRVTHRTSVVDALARRLRERPATHWLPALERVGVPCGVVKTVAEVLAEVEASPLTGIAPSVPGSVRLPPPLLDEHGESIRAQGWNAFAAQREIVVRRRPT